MNTMHKIMTNKLMKNIPYVIFLATLFDNIYSTQTLLIKLKLNKQ